MYDAGIFPDWWKLPPPKSDAAWQNISTVIRNNDPYCRGVVLLGLNAPVEELKRGFAMAQGHDICKGFAVGRSIFIEPARAWLKGEADDEATIAAIAENYKEIIDLWKSHG